MAIESKMNRGPIGRSPQPTGKKHFTAWVWIALLLIISLLGGWWFYETERQAIVPVSQEALVDVPVLQSGDFQAVFLDNGQVYFGKLTRTKTDFYVLKDIYYLQSGVEVDQTANLALTKLGSEAHGPEDQMEINIAHILFIEDMKNDSKVVQAIQQYKSKK